MNNQTNGISCPQSSSTVVRRRGPCFPTCSCRHWLSQMLFLKVHKSHILFVESFPFLYMYNPRPLSSLFTSKLLTWQDNNCIIHTSKSALGGQKEVYFGLDDSDWSSPLNPWQKIGPLATGEKSQVNL